MGVWIETFPRLSAALTQRVTPFVGVWIETRRDQSRPWLRSVTPFVGVWIETDDYLPIWDKCKSHPSWVCGLKLVICVFVRLPTGHTLRGCVD